LQDAWLRLACCDQGVRILGLIAPMHARRGQTGDREGMIAGARHVHRHVQFVVDEVGVAHRSPSPTLIGIKNTYYQRCKQLQDENHEKIRGSGFGISELPCSSTKGVFLSSEWRTTIAPRT